MFVRHRPAVAAGATVVLGLLPFYAPELPTAQAAESSAHFERYVGRWVGEGRLGIRDQTTEQVKCRVTYAYGQTHDTVRQSIRCASAGGNVEVQSEFTNTDGTLKGSWKELVRDWQGSIEGKVSGSGFRLRVTGEALKAQMTIGLREEKQVIEIQFFDSAMIGLTLWLTKG